MRIVGVLDSPNYSARLRRGFRRVVTIYAIVATSWILFAGVILLLLSRRHNPIEWIEIGKGLLFVAVTSTMLSVLLNRLATSMSRVVEERRDVRRRFAAIIEGSWFGVAIWTIDGRLLDVNDALLGMWGYSREEFDQGNLMLLDLSPPEDRDENHALLVEASRGGSAGPFERVMLRRDGSHLPVLAGLAAFDDKWQEGVVYILDDTERRAAQALHRNLVEELERRVKLRTEDLQIANEDLESFSYSVSHDLRAPLRTIEGMTEIVRSEIAGRSEEADRALARISENVERMSGLIEALLKLARLGQGHLQRSRVDISEVARSLVKELAPGRSIVFNIEDGIEVDGDSGLIRALLYNLLQNAVKFTARVDSPTIEVRSEGGWIVVRDNGVGFDATRADKMFEPFTRLHDAQEYPGSGVGLSVVRRIVRRHHGQIEARSLESGGAEFRFTIPGTDSIGEPV